jgi:ABC-type transport system substrate-binding protein
MQGNLIPTADKPSGTNWGRLNNPDYDKACSAEQGALDIPTRVAAFKDLQKAMIDDGSIFALYVRPEVNSVAPYAGNFKLNSSSSLTTWNVPDWFKKSGPPSCFPGSICRRASVSLLQPLTLRIQ